MFSYALFIDSIKFRASINNFMLNTVPERCRASLSLSIPPSGISLSIVSACSIRFASKSSRVDQPS